MFYTKRLNWPSGCVVDRDCLGEQCWLFVTSYFVDDISVQVQVKVQQPIGIRTHSGNETGGAA